MLESAVCKHQGCHVRMRRDELISNHESACGYRTVNCVCCNESMQEKDCEKHLTSICTQNTQPCVLCKVILLQKDHQEHQNTTCPRFSVNCRFIGCPMQMPREELVQHEREAVAQHLALVRASLSNPAQAVSGSQHTCTFKVSNVREKILEAQNSGFLRRHASPFVTLLGWA